MPIEIDDAVATAHHCTSPSLIDSIPYEIFPYLDLLTISSVPGVWLSISLEKLPQFRSRLPAICNKRQSKCKLRIFLTED